MQVHVFKKRRRKRYRKYQAPRPHLTTLRILQVRPAACLRRAAGVRLPSSCKPGCHVQSCGRYYC